MDPITLLGLTAASLTTGAFLPQVIKTWKTRSAKDVSVSMVILFCVGIFLWLVYGILRNDLALILANTITLALNLLILGMKLKYK
ncbi:hypothetical protein BCD67_16850 [Oscillatoriales cyanobacterium USR001]|nr:hypothetical protein BCD67_16850 [Oscillatoriales cyanobacterium USR001]